MIDESSAPLFESGRSENIGKVVVVVLLGLAFAVWFSFSGVGTSSPRSPEFATVSPPASRTAPLYSDTELDSLQQFHSSPGTAVNLTSSVHVEIIETQKRTANVEYGLPGGPSPQYFKHVRVQDGPSRGVEGWIAEQQLRSLATPTSR